MNGSKFIPNVNNFNFINILAGSPSVEYEYGYLTLCLFQ